MIYASEKKKFVGGGGQTTGLSPAFSEVFVLFPVPCFIAVGEESPSSWFKPTSPLANRKLRGERC